MDKGRRNELGKLKFKKRLKNYRLKEGDGKFNCFRTTGKPCSCSMCSPKEEKDKYKVKYKQKLIE
jgi:hypothetical protein